ncbi:hypothetical protein B5X24_HaOG206625 [Helicoverpa armigera]|nr:hypothetical protein B5X24_HaOG206625 [Helicoverpa armigera]
MNPQSKSTALSADLNNFIYGVSRRNAQNAPELTRTGLNLLKNFPAARDAVLEYFAMVFHDAVNVSITQTDYELIAKYFYSVYRAERPELDVDSAIASADSRNGAARVHLDQLQLVDVCRALKALKPKRQLLEYLLQKLEYECLFPDKNIPMLVSAAEEINIVRDKLLDGNQLEKYSLARILILVSYNLPSEFVSTISYLLQYSRDDSTLALLVRIISGTITMHVPNDSPDISMDTERYQSFIKTGVEYALRDAMLSDNEIKSCFLEGTVPKDQKTYLHHFCLNIIKLLRWENSNRVSHLRTRPIGRAVEANLYRIGGALQEYTSLLRIRKECTMASLNEMPTCHALAEVLDRVDMTGTKAAPPSVEVILKVVQATVKYFFRCLHLKDTMEKLRGVATACRLLRKLCLHSKLARALALRELLETAMFREDAAFGSRPVLANLAATKDWRSDDLLIHLNQKHGPITQLTQSHTSVFHAGIIGKGVRKPSDLDVNDIPPILTTNNELLMGALTSCMDGNSGLVEGATSVSLLLVELVSPDVMYNGLPWPDEDFTKQVSIERELYMRGALESCAVARAALRRAAGARPALCLASALLRATAATLLHRLRAYLDRHTQSAEMAKERAALTELLSTMTLGQLLPHPLSHMLELAPELTASEIVQVLRDCLWNYTRDHVPSPALFTCDSTGLHWRDPATCKPPATYTDTLRLIIQKRISKLGHLYPIMFLNLEKEN